MNHSRSFTNSGFTQLAELIVLVWQVKRCLSVC